MELFQLEQFLAAARLENLTRAAEELSLTQPAVSKNIKALEHELGCPLFTREGRSLRLNENGRIFERHVLRAFEALNDGRAELSDISRKLSSSISICVHAASNLIPEMLVEYKQKHPSIVFSLTQDLSEQKMPSSSGATLWKKQNSGQQTRSESDQFRDVGIGRENRKSESAGRWVPGRYDFTIDAGLVPAAPSEGVTLLREELLVALPKSHPLAGRRNIALTELKDEAFVSLRKGFPLSQITDYYCRLSGFTPNVVFDSDNPATLRNIISLGTGVALIPSLTWDMRRYDSLALIPISAPDCIRYITLSCPVDRILTPEKQAFLEYLVERFAALN